MVDALPEKLKIIAIQNYGSSGTLLLHSLLDQHPNIIQLPGLAGLNIFEHLQKYFEDYKKHTKKDTIEISVVESFFFHSFIDLYKPGWMATKNGLWNLGENRDEHPCTDEATFKWHYTRYVKLLLKREGLVGRIDIDESHKYIKEFTHAIYAAYSKSIGDDPTFKNVLVYPIHSGPPQQIIEFQKIFEDCVFIHMLRHPIGVMNSLMKYIEYEQKYNDIRLNMFGCAISQIFQDYAPQANLFYRMYSIYPFPRIDDGPPVSEFSIKLEDLHAYPKKTLQRICELTGINWHDNLMKSTFAGKQWWNRPSSKKISGFNLEMTDLKVLAYFPTFDKWRLLVLVKPLLEGLGYQKKSAKWSSYCQNLGAMALCVLPFYVEWISIQSTRSILLAHQKKMKSGNKFSSDIVKVAHTHWDACRKSSVIHLKTIDEEEDNKPENQRLFYLFRDARGELQSQESEELSTADFTSRTGVIQDPGDTSIPNLTWPEKLRCISITFIREYIENRKKLFEAYKEIKNRQNEMICAVDVKEENKK